MPCLSTTLAQPLPEASVNAGEQYKVMQLLRHESPAVLCRAQQLWVTADFVIMQTEGVLGSNC